MSCDTFVALPPTTGNGCVIFGKNSDRPANEVQEVVFHASTQYEPGTKLQVMVTNREQSKNSDTRKKRALFGCLTLW